MKLPGASRQTLTSALLLLSVLGGSAANAESLETGSPGPVVWMSYYLQAGVAYTIETANLSAGDTVLYVIGPTNETWADDDSGPGVASTIVMVPIYTGYHHIFGAAFSQSSPGNCDVRVNGTTILTQAPFAGIKSIQAWRHRQAFTWDHAWSWERFHGLSARKHNAAHPVR